MAKKPSVKSMPSASKYPENQNVAQTMRLSKYDQKTKNAVRYMRPKKDKVINKVKRYKHPDNK